ncbi:MAG: L,D-transpeptidase family protein [Alphaproteobacteria bacterium]|nr:L,D-transpeptidase family protein [Alphaproteobacteria bacterium]
MVSYGAAGNAAPANRAQEPAAWDAQIVTKPGVEDPVKVAILELLGDPQSVPLPVRQRREALLAYYSNPSSRLLWQGLDNELADAFGQRVKNAEADGLQSHDNLYEQLLIMRRVNRFALSREAHDHQAASRELYWSAALLKYAGEIKRGRLLPTKIDTDLFWQEKSIDEGAALQSIAALGQIDAFFDAWEPQIPLYKALKRALGEYRAIADNGGWPTVDVIDVLKPGEASIVVPGLRQRLAVTDGVSKVPPQATQDETVYSDDLVEGVKRFQRRHGLDDDGILGKKTFFQLNIPVDARIRQIVLSMERVRWMPEDLGKHYVMVNIAGYELRRVKAGKVEEVMRVVVGQPFHQTPVFSETMKYIEINPYWNVPHSIAVNEELPKLQQSPGARAEKGFEAVVGDKAVPLTAINWQKYSKSNFPVQLRQKPGPGNALGQVKFMFPNRFNVYMHDTPARSLFSQSERAFSHGCIRLARPIDMAEQVLATSTTGWDRKRIDGVLAKGERRVVSLATPIEVHITYSTAWRDEDGDVQFRPDIYRRDAKLYAALFGKAYPY